MKVKAAPVMRCIFCSNELTAKTRPEHILQVAAGGKKTTRRAICSECNERFGGTIDKNFGEQVAVLRNLLQLGSGTGKPPPMLRNIKSGNNTLNFRNDGTPELVTRPFTVTKRADGAEDIKVVLNNPEELANIIPHLAARLRCSEEEVKKVLASGETKLISKRPDPIHFNLSFGGPLPLRSITKSCLVLWTVRVGNEEVRSPPYEDARRFVLDGGEAFNVARIHLDSRYIPCAEELFRRFGQFFNLIYVASDAHGRVVAHFTLYNIIGWHIVLAEHGGTPGTKIGLISNPLAPSMRSDTIADEIHIDFAWLDTPDYSDQFARTRDRFTSVGKRHREMVRSREIESIVDDVCRKHFREDAAISESVLEKILYDIGGRFTLYILNQPHEEKLTPVELAAYLVEKRKD
jgi:hypothetical protein